MGVKEQKDETEEAKLENRFWKYKFSGAETQVYIFLIAWQSNKIILLTICMTSLIVG